MSICIYPMGPALSVHTAGSLRRDSGMAQADAIDGLIGQLYEAALSPELWHPTLLRIGSVIGADALHLFAWDQGADSARLALNRPGISGDSRS